MLIHVPTLRLIAVAMPKKDPRTVLRGVHITQTDDRFQMEATGGTFLHRQYYTSTDCDDKAFVEASKGSPNSIILHHETVTILAKADNFGTWARFDSEGGFIIDPTGLNKIMAITVEGKYPETDAVMPSAKGAKCHELTFALPVLKLVVDTLKAKPLNYQTVTFHLLETDGKLDTQAAIGFSLGTSDIVNGVAMPVKITRLNASDE